LAEELVLQLVKRIFDFDRRISFLDKRLNYIAKISWTFTAGVITILIVNMVLRLYLVYTPTLHYGVV